MEWPCTTCECRKALYACEQETCDKVRAYEKLKNQVDHIEVAKIAYDMVLKTMQEGEIKYPDHRWKKQGIFTHIMHAKDHVEAFNHNWGKGTESDEDDIAHAMTRLAMIRWKEMREKK